MISQCFRSFYKLKVLAAVLTILDPHESEEFSVDYDDADEERLDPFIGLS
jgi:hypothetical protein